MAENRLPTLNKLGKNQRLLMTLLIGSKLEHHKDYTGQKDKDQCWLMRGGEETTVSMQMFNSLFLRNILVKTSERVPMLDYEVDTYVLNSTISVQ